jgi:circadian clock protein KaiC
MNQRRGRERGIAKVLTGVPGLDEVTGGGLPAGRPTLICGSAGSGKTLLGTSVILNGIVKYDEPGLIMTFEENAEELTDNVASLGFDLTRLIARKKLAVDYVHVDRAEIEETGEYDLEALFVRIAHAVASVGARRVMLDTVESLFGGLPSDSILRAELRRLFRWLKDRALTTIITGERGTGALTRHGLEEYVSDAVILLDHRVQEQISTRRLRIVKYRGSAHGTNEYPFLISARGISVEPVTAVGLQHPALRRRISSGIAELDAMLGGKGYFVGSSVLVSGTAGTGKTSVAAHFAESVAAHGQRCLYFVFEESASQLMRNMASIGIDLTGPIRAGRLRIHAARPTHFGLEEHLAAMRQMIDDYRPAAVVVDPLSNLVAAGERREVSVMLLRLIDLLKARGITALFTTLTPGGRVEEATDVGVSSLTDTWLMLGMSETAGERHRQLLILKSRGMAHSQQLREYKLTSRGLRLLEFGPSALAATPGSLNGRPRPGARARRRAGAVR